MNAASNIINQIEDINIDRLNKSTRPLITGEIGIKEAWILTLSGYIIALVPTWFIVPAKFWGGLSERLYAPLLTHETFLIYLSGLIFTFIYSVPLFGRTKRLGFIANWTIAIPRGCLLKVAGWAMVATIADPEPWFLGLIFMLFLLGATTTKDFADIEGDKMGGCKTLPILYGADGAAKRIAPFFILPWLLLPIGLYLKNPLHQERIMLSGNPVILWALGLLLSFWGIFTVRMMLKDPDALSRTENHPSWKHMYYMMMTAQIGLAAAYTFNI